MTFRELLKSKDCSASRLARAIGVTTEAACIWARNECAPSLSNAVKIAEFLGVSIDTVAQCFEGE